ncbi:MAG: SPOR domain-containing protein [Candidatus Omnitrophica bacterium]|nr:SPOR domain-containing protein [Candidatus Omnitrophota bacterium]
MKTFFCLFISYFLILTTCLFAQDFEEAQVSFLKGEYRQSIEKLEGILAKEVDRPSSARLYYLLGLSYLKAEIYLKAGDCFDIIVNEYRNSHLVGLALIKLIDIKFLKGDYIRALNSTGELSARFVRSEFESPLLLRQYLLNLKLGNWKEANSILTRIRESFPVSPAMKTILDGNLAVDFFSVQVGSFKNRRNATNLSRLLNSKGFDSFVLKNADSFFRVRVGRLATLEAAQALEKDLIKQGFITKIYP